MAYTTLIDPADLVRHLDTPDWAVIDCRFSLQDTEQARRDYLQAHIPGAIYAHLDEDLSAPVVPGVTGRHPLADSATVARTFGAWGIDAGVQVVAYDDRGGALAAARLWWMLRWLGHDAVAVLNGGWPLWQQIGYPTREGNETRPARQFVARPRPELLVSSAEVQQQHTDPAYRLVDARSADRYRGENETIDPQAGHIPGARSGPFAANLAVDGRLLAPDHLQEHYRALLEETPAERTMMYCGSGVSAAHNILALEHAGMGTARLYVGSWSEWITDPTRPTTQGEQP